MKIIAQFALFTMLTLSGVACSPASDRGPDSKAKASTFDKATMDTLLGGAVESGKLIGVQANKLAAFNGTAQQLSLIHI